LNDSGYQFNLAIFTDSGGNPGTLIVAGTPQAAVVGWNFMPIASTPLSAGTYWMALKGSNNNFNIKNDGNSPGTDYYTANDPWNGGAFVSPFPAPSLKWTYYLCSITGNYCQ